MISILLNACFVVHLVDIKHAVSVNVRSIVGHSVSNYRYDNMVQTIIQILE